MRHRTSCANHLDALMKKSFVLGKADILVTDASYKGPHLPQKINMKSVMSLISSFQSNVLLHMAYVERLLASFMQHATTNWTSLMNITIPKGGKLVVVGDIHGQLTDLVTIFQAFGLPSTNNIYLFNGDFIDRGPQGVEVLLILYALVMCNPSATFLNRGNHEQRYICESYSFGKEVTKKYSPEIFDVISESFKSLPLFTVINDKVLVLHGGLSNFAEVTLHELSLLPHNVEPVQLRPFSKTNPQLARELHLIECALWSDPADDIIGTQPSPRQVAVLWGPDVTETFLRTNNLSLIIRSHEPPDEGFQWHHQGQVLTLFSASNYNGCSDNKGAVGIFSDDEFSEAINSGKPPIPTIHPFYAMVFQSTAVNCQQITIEKLRKRIFINRNVLAMEFASIDWSQKGQISIPEFIEVMKKVISDHLQWEHLWKYFAVPNSDEKIAYMEFLDQHNIIPQDILWDTWADLVEERINQFLLENIGSIEEAFAFFDTDGNRQISYAEFLQTLSSFDLKLSNEQICDLFLVVDKNKDGKLDYNEFNDWLHKNFEAVKKAKWSNEQKLLLFSIVESTSIPADPSSSLASPGTGCSSHLAKLHLVFSSIDSDSDGLISPPEFFQFLKSHAPTKWAQHTESDAAVLLKSMMTKNSSAASPTISFDDFEHALRQLQLACYEKENERAFYRQIRGSIAREMCKKKVYVNRLFRQMDVDCSGTITADELKAGLKALSILLDIPLSDDQIKRLHESMDTNHDGLVSLEEFKAALLPDRL
ncbi:serine/threonine protein phosphatase [Pelomyxa schiedti]|nr:serine/threonine protein phosphatase [Pelomyxa schiedti]